MNLPKEKFTPGPWKSVKNNGQVDIIQAVSGAPKIATIHVYGVMKSNANANGRLIAAAPAMYEALQAILYAPGFGKPGHIDFKDSIEMGKKALALADGGK